MKERKEKERKAFPLNWAAVMFASVGCVHTKAWFRQAMDE
jgi:hypothetical protein